MLTHTRTVVGRQVDGVPLDAGLWVSAFDSAGLRELRALPDLGVPAIAQRMGFVRAATKQLPPPSLESPPRHQPHH